MSSGSVSMNSGLTSLPGPFAHHWGCVAGDEDDALVVATDGSRAVNQGFGKKQHGACRRIDLVDEFVIRKRGFDHFALIPR